MKLLLESVLKSKVTSKLIHSFANSLMDLIPISKPSKSLVPFITALINESQVSSVVVYLAKIYLDRLKPLLISCTGLPSTWHRLALSVLIIAEKSICDVPMRNKYWQEHAKLFSLEEVNLMERQLLSLMDYRIEVGVEELYEAVLGMQPAPENSNEVFSPLPFFTNQIEMFKSYQDCINPRQDYKTPIYINPSQVDVNARLVGYY